MNIIDGMVSLRRIIVSQLLSSLTVSRGEASAWQVIDVTELVDTTEILFTMSYRYMDKGMAVYEIRQLKLTVTPMDSVKVQ